MNNKMNETVKMKEKDEKNEKIIIHSIYQRETIQFNAYTAEWCNPCKRIKPKLIETMFVNNFDFILNEELTKTYVKKNINEYIPYFEIKSNDILIDSIQTSNENTFMEFLNRNGITKLILDDDF